MKFLISDSLFNFYLRKTETDYIFNSDLFFKKQNFSGFFFYIYENRQDNIPPVFTPVKQIYFQYVLIFCNFIYLRIFYFSAFAVIIIDNFFIPFRFVFNHLFFIHWLFMCNGGMINSINLNRYI